MGSMMKGKLAAVLLAGGSLFFAAPTTYAAVCSLSSLDATCTFATDSSTPDAIYQNPDNSTVVGSGLIDPFLTVQNNGTESGFSTDAPSNDLPLDTKRAEGNGQFTRTFTIGDLFAVTVNGTSYYRFFLDINEPSGGTSSLLSLDLLKIYNTGSSSAVTLGSGTTLADLGTQGWSLLYDLGANSLGLDYDVFGSGSGKGIDLEVLIPTSVFTGSTTDRIVFATQFSGAGDGFEEWWYQARGTSDVCPPGTVGTPPNCTIPPVLIPEPGSLTLVGLAMFGLLGVQLVRRRAVLQ
ncbi:hypothetical protein CJ010_02485 [Azoarcus sp. DD4]|uniref:PEP-CTERM sorting domain-containing protein n=1 Tax=Azoarcus sp. DD4 TaxID=2027405 RepID=UPI00112700EF|nr:PEP-CTERM sorting domain-containing protein [Azoarcus sp. DD4]QDF95498.1 hypothetical protein CJ010_02485 [Azoarcus sp. DD4]